MLDHGSRLKSFKNNGRDLDDMRRRRTESSIELRKQKKEDQVLKRRNIGPSNGDEDTPLNDKTNLSGNMSGGVNSQQSVAGVASLSLEEIIQVILMLKNPDGTAANQDNVHLAVQAVRKMLSRERNPPIDDVIRANLVPNLVSYLSCEEHPNLQFEAAWALTNIASGTSLQTRHVVEAGAIKPFIRLLSSSSSCVQEQSVWALGNIAGDGAELRDLVIDCGIIKPLLSLIRPDTPNTFLRNITWTLSNLCRNKNPAPSMQVIHELLPSLANLLYSNDKEVLTDTCWALSYITDGPNEKIDAVIKTGVVSRLVELLNMHHKNEVGILSPALRCIGNIVTGSDDQTQAVIDANVLPIFHALLTHSKVGVQKEAAWALSNITAGTQSQIQAVIQAELVPLLVHVLSVGELRVQKEAAWAVTNYTSGASTEQVLFLVQCQILKPMCDLLVAKDAKLLKVLLDGLINILMVAEKVGQLDNARMYIEEIDGLNKIDKLQENDNEDVYKSAYHIIDRYFNYDDEDDAALQPGVAGDQYNFTATEITSSANSSGKDSAAPKFTF